MTFQRWSLGTVPRLDLVEWTDPIWYRVLSYYFSVQTSDTDLADYVHQVIGVFEVDRDRSEERNPPTPGVPVSYKLNFHGDDETPRFSLHYNDQVFAASDNGGYVLDQLFWHINAECARLTGDYVLIHAGAVSTPSGRGVVIPGASGAGKSTIVVGLLREGFSYYSDEAAAIDPIQRHLHPYPKAVTLKDRTVFDKFPEIESARVANRFVRNRWYLLPSLLPRGLVGERCEVGYVIVSRFSPGATTTLRPITPAEAGHALGRNAMNAGRYGARILPLLADLVKGSEAFELESGDLKEAVAAIVEATSDRVSANSRTS